MSAPLLSLRNITKSYGQVLANSGIDLDVGAQSIHAILGENGVNPIHSRHPRREWRGQIDVDEADLRRRAPRRG
jgi:ABC-type branched-subunit amino acid transport system ATPase component